MNKKSCKFLLIRETWSHMAEVSGFDPVFSRLEPLLTGSVMTLHAHESRPTKTLAGRLRAKIGRTLGDPSNQREILGSSSPFVTLIYNDLAEKVFRLLEDSPGLIAVLSAAENQFGGLLEAAPLAIKSRIHAVFHQPPSWHRLFWKSPESLQGLGSVICLSKHQEEYFRSITNAPVIRLMHGVESGFFSPGTGFNGRNLRLVCVGHWLRDLNTLRRCMDLLWNQFPELELDYVLPHNARNLDSDLIQLARDRRVRWHAGLSSSQLRDLYQSGSLLLLPLFDSTANNALVEALACGLPIVSTRIGGVSDYVPDECSVLCPPGNAEAHAAAVIGFLNDEKWRKDASIAARRHACEHLCWDQSASLLASLLQS